MEKIHYRHFRTGRSAIKLLEIDGVKRSPTGWSELVEGRSPAMIRNRIKSGMSLKEAVFGGVERKDKYRNLWPAINPTPGKWA